jgi:SPP1 gp7 family putative phage head morphogenesis protein
LLVRVTKRWDLGTPRGFDRAVAELAAKLRRVAALPESDAVREALAVLDVDWRRTTPAQRHRLMTTALDAARRRTAIVPDRIVATLGEAADEVVAATRDHARRAQGLSIAASFNALDRRIIQHVVASEANYVRDEYGRRQEAFSQEARRIVTEGLEAGLGRDDIAQALERAAGNVLEGQRSFYWDVVASSFIGRGRSYAQLSAYEEAGVERYRFEAVLDERTTEICRFMHGRTFEVRHGLELFARVESEPARLIELAPWVREATDRETGRKLLYVNRGGERESVALVTRSAMGTRDDVGDFDRGRSTEELVGLGLILPPVHALCRSVSVADF